MAVSVLLQLLSGVLTNRWVWLALALLLVTVSEVVIHLTWEEKSATAPAAEHTTRPGSGHHELAVRPTWARAAVAMDITLALGSTLEAVLMATRDSGDSRHTLPTAALWVLVVAGAWFWNHAHRQATRPATPHADTAHRE